MAIIQYKRIYYKIQRNYAESMLIGLKACDYATMNHIYNDRAVGKDD